MSYLHADGERLMWHCLRCGQHVVVGQTVTPTSLVSYAIRHARQCRRPSQKSPRQAPSPVGRRVIK
jgi:hypothetical protein